VHWAAHADELEQSLDVPPARTAPPSLATAWMHQAEHPVGDEAVVDEEILMNAEARVLALQVPRLVVRDAVTQHQILSACGRSNRVSLHEPKCLERFRKRCRWKEAPRDRMSA
jgi:hypothetical protein